MMHRDEVIRRIHAYFGEDLLRKAKEKDLWLANGIQILGKEKVSKIVVGVSATQALFVQAKKAHADMILCKHPIRIDAPNQILPPFLQERLRTVFLEHWTIGGYHYPLDVHPEVGNTPLLLRALKAVIDVPIHKDWGFCATLPQPITIPELEKQLSLIVHHPVKTYTNFPNHGIQRIGVVSGAAVPAGAEFMELIQKGIELYITGEISEWAVHQFQESGIAYTTIGHHAGETLGPQAFAQRLPELLDHSVDVEFIQVWNDI